MFLVLLNIILGKWTAFIFLLSFAETLALGTQVLLFYGTQILTFILIICAGSTGTAFLASQWRESLPWKVIKARQTGTSLSVNNIKSLKFNPELLL